MSEYSKPQERKDINRRQFNSIFEQIIDQHYDLIEITTSEEYSHRVINPSIITNLLLLELNGIFPDTTPKVIETFKSELSYDGDPANTGASSWSPPVPHSEHSNWINRNTRTGRNSESFFGFIF